MKETSVVVQMDNSRALNMDQVVSEVKLQYEDIAARSREEAEIWHRTKVIKQKYNLNNCNCSYALITNVMFDVCWDQFDQMTAEADQYGNELRSAKAEISELNRMISRLQNEIAALKNKVRLRHDFCWLKHGHFVLVWLSKVYSSLNASTIHPSTFSSVPPLRTR